MPATFAVTPGTDLGDEGEVIAVRVQRLANQLIGDMRPVEVAGVDVVHAGFDGLAQYGQRGRSILGRAEYAGACQLHRAVTDAVYLAVAQSESAAVCQARHSHHPCFI